VKKLIACCNKMDATPAKPFDEARFNEIRDTVKYFLKKKNMYKKAKFIPISGWTGDNLLEKSTNMDWYYADKKKYATMTLLQTLDKIKPPKRPTDKALRLPLQDVYKIQGIGTVPVGRVETGVIKPGMNVLFAPCNKECSFEVKSVEMHHEQLEQACPGDNVGFNVKGLTMKDVKRGFVCSNAKKNPAKVARRFLAQVIVLNHKRIANNYTPVLDCHTAHIACKFNTIVSEIDARDGKVKKKNPEFVKTGQACMAVLIPTKQMCVESFTDFAPLGRFAIRDMRKTVAVGIVKKVQVKEEGPEPTGLDKKKKPVFSHDDDNKWAE